MKKHIFSAAATLLALALSLASLVSCNGGGGGGGGDTTVAVAGVALDRNTMTLAIGDATGTLVPAVTPADATNKGVKWTVADTGIATVSDAGEVTPRAVGKTTITASSSDGSNKKAECFLEVIASPIPAIAAAPNKYVTTIAPGGKEAFVITFYPANATNQNVTWRSSDASVAEVSATGEVTAKRAGTVTITATPAQPPARSAAHAQDTDSADGADGPRPNVGDGDGSMGITVTVPNSSVPVTGVTLDRNAIELTVGSTDALVPTVQPSNATNQTVNWMSSDTAKAIVSSAGVVTALAPGTAVVAVATADGGRMAMCTVTVSPAPAAPVHPTGVTLDKSSVTLEVWATAALAPTVLPDDATNRNVYWLTSDPGVAVVSSNGLVTAVAPGTATITVATVDGGKTATCAVTVTAAPVPVTGVSLNKGGLLLAVGGSERLVETIQPAGATNRNVYWTTSNSSVAIVSSGGVVTAVGNGNANITVTTQDGGKTAACAVTVTAAPPPVTGVTLDRARMSLALGESEALVATVLPESAANRNVTWATSNAGVATVSQTGVVTATGRGTATITAASVADPTRTATCEVTLVNVYVSGWRDYQYFEGGRPLNGHRIASMWQNGVPYHLPRTTETEDTYACQGMGAFVAANGDVYTAGYEFEYLYDGATGEDHDNEVITVWKNGLPHQHIRNDDYYNYYDGSYELFQPNSLFVSGDDVYVAGILSEHRPPNGSQYYPMLWKNGVQQVLETKPIADGAMSYAWAMSVFVSNGNVYVAGIDASDYALPTQRLFPVLWVNGAATYLNSGTGNGVAYSVHVSGGDVYVGGYENIDGHARATVWKNGAAQRGAVPEGSLSEYVRSVAVSGGDVYAAGFCYYQTTTPTRKGAVLWKNGVAQHLSPTDGSADAYSVCVYGGDVYVVGIEEINGESVPTIWKNGVARRLGKGTMSSYSTVVVSSVAKDVSGASLEWFPFENRLRVNAGYSEQLSLKVQPFGASNAASWSSGNAAIATVSSSGAVTGVAPGTATITAATLDGNKSATFPVDVLPTTRVTGVSLPPSLSLVVGGSTSLIDATVLPADATNKTVIWTSSNTDVAQISTGWVYSGGVWIPYCRVQTVAPGTATITARTEDGGFTATCAVTVVPAGGVADPPPDEDMAASIDNWDVIHDADGAWFDGADPDAPSNRRRAPWARRRPIRIEDPAAPPTE